MTGSRRKRTFNIICNGEGKVNYYYYMFLYNFARALKYGYKRCSLHTPNPKASLGNSFMENSVWPPSSIY